MTAANPFNSVQQLLESKDSLQYLQQRLQQHQELLQLVYQLLPSRVHSHCLAAVLNDRQLILFADSPVWNAVLRYHSGELIIKLRQRGYLIDRIRTRVALPEMKDQQQSAAAGFSLSEESRCSLLQAASTVKDEALSAALRRLVKDE